MKSTMLPRILLTLKRHSGIKQEKSGYAANLESVGANGSVVTECMSKTTKSDSQFIQDLEWITRKNGLL